MKVQYSSEKERSTPGSHLKRICFTKIKKKAVPLVHHGDPHRKEMQVLEFLAFLPLFLSRGRTDIWTDGRIAGTQSYKMFTEEKRADTHTDKHLTYSKLLFYV